MSSLLTKMIFCASCPPTNAAFSIYFQPCIR
jgi:hypothetical protein